MNDTVRIIENLPGMIPDDKASILLVQADLKPSAAVVLQGDIFHLPGDVVHIPESTLTDLDHVLKKLKLQYTTTTEVMENVSGKPYPHAQEVMRIYISKDQMTVDDLKRVFDDITNNHHEAGLLLGYPKSAVDAFLTPDMLEWEDYPKSTEAVSKLNMRLLGHRLSKNNWREEIKYLEPSGNYLKSVSPTLYNLITAEDS